jgi:beta-lactam-binding protein with PASTA domain
LLPTPVPIKVPDVRGMSEPDAIIALNDADLRSGNASASATRTWRPAGDQPHPGAKSR